MLRLRLKIFWSRQDECLNTQVVSMTSRSQSGQKKVFHHGLMSGTMSEACFTKPGIWQFIASCMEQLVPSNYSRNNHDCRLHNYQNSRRVIRSHSGIETDCLRSTTEVLGYINVTTQNFIKLRPNSSTCFEWHRQMHGF